MPCEGSSAAELAVHARLEQLVAERVEEGVDLVLGGLRRGRASARARHGPRAGSSCSANALEERPGSARAIRSALAVGSFQAPVGIDHHLAARRGVAVSHWRTAFEVTMSPTRTTSSGSSRSGRSRKIAS